MTTGKLDGKVAIVTGAARGIGRAIATQFVADGAAVALADLDGAGAEEAAAALRTKDARVLGARVDVTSESSQQELVARTVAELGRLDVMVANAGIIHVKPIVELAVEDWDRMFAVNVRGVFLSFKAAAQQLIRQGEGGRLLATASIAGKMGSPFQAHYQSSKAAVIGMVRSAAWEFGQHGITVNCYCPGIVDTDMWKHIDAERGRLLGKEPGQLFKEQAPRSPLGRTEVPEDVAPLVSFLASEGSRYITGQAINVDGGVVMW